MNSLRPRLSLLKKAQHTLDSFTASGRALFLFFAGVCVISSIGLLYILNASLLVAAPAHGGSMAEGILGSPRFINPVLAQSDADRDATALTYSGLLRATPQGSYVPDLAQEYTVSEDGRVYTFILREGTTFHDGKPVTSDDVVFTVGRIQDPAIKSPLRANWDGVLAEAPDQRTVRFTLKSPYAPFVKNLTLGILPKALWSNVSVEEFSFSNLNANPIGSGPYRVGEIVRTASGIPSSYALVPFADYSLGRPYISLTLRFYQNEDSLVQALQDSDVDAASGISPEKLDNLEELNITTAPFNRVFAVFFNQNQSELLRQRPVRAALNTALDRDDLIQKVLGGYGTPLMGPVPPSVLAAEASSSAQGLEAARAILERDGWEMNESGVLTKTTGKGASATTQVLEFDLATANVPELRAAAQYLHERSGQLGVQVTLQVFEAGDLSQNVIRPRRFDALLFGEVIGRELDLFAFWHSSQRNDPGLNVAGYANATADDVLERLRETADTAQRQALYQEFSEELRLDLPAVFLYAPDFVYSIPKDIQGLDLGLVESPSDRFLSVTQWHRQVDYVWPLFAGGRQ